MARPNRGENEEPVTKSPSSPMGRSSAGSTPLAVEGLFHERGKGNRPFGTDTVAEAVGGGAQAAEFY